MKSIVVAVDGPAGAGKSTICKIVGEKMNLEYIDTGAMYRALTLKVIENKIDFDDIESIKNILDETKIDLVNGAIILDGIDVSKEIRMPYISQNVSEIAKIKEVREFLVNIQRNMGNEKNVIMDGRDIGTKVLTNATLKIFLTASVKERAERRYKELIEKGLDVDFNNIYEEIEKRDFIDSNREISPLCKAEDAVLVDTTGKNIQEVVNEIISLIDRS